MNTATLHISLPESLNRFIQERVEKEHYSNPSDYIQTLIHDEQKRAFGGNAARRISLWARFNHGNARLGSVLEESSSTGRG